MNAIAWAMICVALILQPERDRNSKYYNGNNTIDIVLFVFCFVKLALAAW